MRNIQNPATSEPLTGAKLKELIRSVIADAFDDAWSDEQLLAEPELNEDPPLLELKEKPDTYGKVLQILKRLPNDQRERVFRSFGRYSMEYVLQHINRVKKATDPKSDI